MDDFSGIFATLKKWIPKAKNKTTGRVPWFSFFNFMISKNWAFLESKISKIS
jgi:hypothetical protein